MQSMLIVQTAAPAPALRPFIKAYVYRAACLGAEELVEPVVARLGVMLEFEFAGAYEVRNYGTELQDDSNPISIIGPQTWRRARLIIRGSVESLVVLFEPCGFYALLGVPTAPLAEGGTEGHAVLGLPISRLHQRLGNTKLFSERVRCLNEYFLSRLPGQVADKLDPVVRTLHALTMPGQSTVGDVARGMGISRRQLERHSLACAGVTPQDLRRISRFSRALRLRSESSLTWTEIAHATDYYDQMHMIRDFRVFAGQSPTVALEDIEPEHLIHYCAQVQTADSRQYALVD